MLLSVIMVGQNVSSAAADHRSLQTYNDAEAVLKSCIELHDHLEKQDAVLSALLAKVA